MLPDVADRLVGPSALVRANIRWAHSVSEHWFNTTHIDFIGEEEFVGIFGVAILTDALVWDSGSRRHVVRAKNRLIPSSIKPCNFTVRGINTGGMQPSWMGDVEELLPLRGGGVVRCLLKGAVCIEQSPHDIISACLLENDGVCDWRGVLPDGNEVYLENHRFLLMPRCTTGQTTHSSDTGGNASCLSAIVAAWTCWVRRSKWSEHTTDTW